MRCDYHAPTIGSGADGSDVRRLTDDAAEEGTVTFPWKVAHVDRSVVALPLATIPGAALALRPRRRGTPQRSSQVVQTQIILAIIGALVMLVVGNSPARAFGVVGAAGLVRYRAKIDDPKDAGVCIGTDRFAAVRCPKEEQVVANSIEHGSRYGSLPAS